MNKVYTYMSRCDCSIRVIIEAEQSSLNTCRRHVITSVNMTNRQDMLEKARLAEQAERYEDMTEYMEKLVEIVGTTTNQHLNTEERNLLSVAFKNVVGSRRSSWRVISSIEQKLERSGDETKKRLTGEYRKSVEDEIQSACNKVLVSIHDKQKWCKSWLDCGSSANFFFLIYRPPQINSLFPIHHPHLVTVSSIKYFISLYSSIIFRLLARSVKWCQFDGSTTRQKSSELCTRFQNLKFPGISRFV